eukprot:9274970-Ditylum_brightwellii.AAC.1
MSSPETPRRLPRKKQGPSLPDSAEEENDEEKMSREKMFGELYAFKAQNGHCNVSQNGEQNKSLAQRVSQQRLPYRKNTLNSDQLKQSISVDFKLDKHDLSWNEKFNQLLCTYKAQNEHCIVSTHDEQNNSLQQWVSQQTVSYKNNTLNSDRIQEVNSIGF